MTGDSSASKSSWGFGWPLSGQPTAEGPPASRSASPPDLLNNVTPGSVSMESLRASSPGPAPPVAPESITPPRSIDNESAGNEAGLADDGTTAAVDSKERDRQFYYTLITFDVENVLFRVPRRPFETESIVFKEMFELPSDACPDGETDDKPLSLQGITVKNFRAFLRVLFDPVHGLQADLTQEEWISVLQLAHMWSCDRLFALAISKLGPFEVDPIYKITLARAYSVSDWLPPAYFELVTRAEPLTLQDAEKLGMETAMKLAEIRESRFRWIIDDLEQPRPQPAAFSPYGLSKKGKNSARGRSPVVLTSLKKDVTLLDDDVRKLIKQILHT